MHDSDWQWMKAACRMCEGCVGRLCH
jgi:hypothetical protein